MHPTAPFTSRPFPFRLIAAAVAAALLVGAGVVGIAGPADADDSGTPTAISQGSLTWGVKASWRGYAGAAELTDGATELPASDGVPGAYQFPLSSGSFDATTGTTTLAFSGEVHWRSHNYVTELQPTGYAVPPGYTGPLDISLLDVTMTDPQISIGPDGGQLTVELTSRRLTDWTIVDYGRVPIESLGVAGVQPTVSGGTTTWSDLTATWLQAGVTAIGYNVGQIVDPVSFSYQGPGGAPIVDEHFTDPSSVGMSLTGNGLIARYNQFGVLGIDNKDHQVWYWGADGTNYTVGAFDLDSMQPVGTPLVLAPADYVANTTQAFFDPTTGRDYLKGSTAGTDLTVSSYLSWDSSAQKLTTTAIDPLTITNGSTGVLWDDARHRAISIGRTLNNGTYDWFADIYTRQPDDSFAHTRQQLPYGDAGLNDLWYNTVTTSSAVLSDGSILMPRVGLKAAAGTTLPTDIDALRIVLGGDGLATVQDIAGTSLGTATNTRYSKAYAALDGKGYLVRLGAPQVHAVVQGVATSASTATTSGASVDLGGNPASLFAVDPSDGTIWGEAVVQQTLTGVRDGAIVHTETSTKLNPTSGGVFFGTTPHTLYAVSSDGQPVGLGVQPMFGFASFAIGTSPAITQQPTSSTVDIGTGATTADATFTAAATGSPAPTVRWQSRAAGALAFSDIDGATSTTLTVHAAAVDNASQYRAVFTNLAGDIATEPATLTVQTAPTVTVQPTSAIVKAGDTTTFQVMGAGSPDPTISWQRLAGTSWVDITADDGFGLGNGTLAIPSATTAQNGLQLRARLSNPVGVAYSDTVTLTVTGTDAGTGPGAAKPTVAGSLSWGVKDSWRSYIIGPIASGWVAVSGGASAGGSTYTFPQGDGATWTADAGAGSAPYRGAVQFYGHAGILNLTFSNPQITIDSPSHASLSFSVNGSGSIGIGSVDLSHAAKRNLDGGVGYSNAPVSLTGAGVGVFSSSLSAGAYPAGEAMDPVSFTIGAASTVTGGAKTTVSSFKKGWTPPADPPATTGIDLTSGDPGDLVAGSTITISADGFQPNEKDIRLVIYSSPRILADDLVADASGTVTWTGTLPADLTGEHTLTLQGSVNRGIVLDIKAADTVGQCTVDGASVQWGFKESFRAYISSSIANGKWTEADGATYATPNFGWPDGSGSLDATTGAALVKFAGSVNFTGHDGVLNTTIANPQVELVDKRTGFLLLDVNGPTDQGVMIDAPASSFVQLDLSKGKVTYNPDGSITAKDVPTTLTADGNTAFPDYPAGTAMDPISFTLPAATGCGTPVKADLPATGGDTSLKAVPISSAVVWPWWAGGSLLAALIVAAIVLLLLRRRRDAATAGGAE